MTIDELRNIKGCGATSKYGRVHNAALWRAESCDACADLIISSLRATRDRLMDLLVEVERLTIDHTPGPGQWSEVKRLANDARAALGQAGGK